MSEGGQVDAQLLDDLSNALMVEMSHQHTDIMHPAYRRSFKDALIGSISPLVIEVVRL
jgi:hypothetical protein